ncbi:hypothetical protein LAX18_01460 [Escherichia coli]|uniref:hypothetical protein n=2 Tax=Escherichia coli TaxID=562 RepID=UPI0018446184|nr:hypothetical protein [Escherichia coli]EFC9828540.1 hypothetical protein [Escherichia coli]EFH6211445.1 hypothetical protein [Escherichia coli]EFH9590350.1 hypothetical protein [Escherichia coli]EFI1494297.1 hypothetical protein [Escherichia coli]EGM1488367.1 hypothetical protein [Escherichia coli]
MKIANVLYLLPLLALSGCALSENLSPPPNGKTVKVAVVKSADVDILPMDVIYRSEKCRDKIFTSTGAINSRPGYHLLTVPFNPENGSNRVSNNIALDGGGQCEWKLSNIKIDFQYHNMKKFGAGVKRNIPSDIVFVFDRNAPPRGDGHYDDVYGDIEIKKNYYPLIRKKNTDEEMLVLSVQGQPMLTYRVHDANSIVFEPIFHSEMVVNAVPPKEKGSGYTIIYPNGDEIIDRYFPNSEKTKYEFVKQKSR